MPILTGIKEDNVERVYIESVWIIIIGIGSGIAIHRIEYH